jgi:HD superfamily phosphohydrolase
MGLSNLVYPGAHHTRFHHALGCMYLMQKAIRVLRFKGVTISDDEEQALFIAILLHDIGHGPFSHALESFFLPGISHEEISLAYMESLNNDFNGELAEAITIYKEKHPRKFLFQLISSQLDMDRLDYLKRDSFYTGVVEGSINSDRLIAMLNVKDDELVIEEKGIYSIEKFLLSRRFMYWQVYLHKTGLIAEQVLKRVLLRARDLIKSGVKITSNVNLTFLLESEKVNKSELSNYLSVFSNIDDHDIWAAFKEWQIHDDFVLSSLSKMLINRKLPHVILSDIEYSDNYLETIKEATLKLNGITNKNIQYFVFDGKVTNQAYNLKNGGIKVLLKNGIVKEWLSVDTQFNTTALTTENVKYFIAYPKVIK